MEWKQSVDIILDIIKDLIFFLLCVTIINLKRIPENTSLFQATFLWTENREAPH